MLLASSAWRPDGAQYPTVLGTAPPHTHTHMPPHHPTTPTPTKELSGPIVNKAKAEKPKNNATLFSTSVRTSEIALFHFVPSQPKVPHAQSSLT